MVKNNKIVDIIEKFKTKILKDNDFTTLGMKLNISREDAKMLQFEVCSDAEFLKGYNLTDYSILLTVHKYTEEAFNQNKSNYRIIKSIDGLYLYNISIIDFLVVKPIFLF